MITGVLRWKFGGRELERDHATVAVRRGAEWKILAQQVTPRAAPPAVFLDSPSVRSHH